MLAFSVLRFPGGSVVKKQTNKQTTKKKPACQCRGCRRHEFDSWLGRIPWRRVHSSILSWKISRTEEPRRLQSMELQRVEQGWTWMHAHSMESQFCPFWGVMKAKKKYCLWTAHMWLVLMKSGVCRVLQGTSWCLEHCLLSICFEQSCRW